MNKKIFLTLAISTVFALGFSAALTSQGPTPSKKPAQKELVVHMTKKGAEKAAKR